MTSTSGGTDHYKTLQVDPEADPEVIQAAYHRLARKFHPDTGADADPGRMAHLNAAWEVLRDPARRAAYDRARARAAAAVRSSVAGAGAASVGGASVGPAPGGPTPGAGPRGAAGPPDPTSPDWTSGRSTVGGGYDPASMRSAEGHGAAGPPPGDPSGTVLGFGRYAGWSLGEIARADVEYLEWLDRAPIGRAYRAELDALLRKVGRRRTASRPDETGRRGLFRR